MAAALGVALALFEIYIILRWVTGPNFQEVPSGPSVPPTWMAVSINVAQVVCPLVLIALIYRFVIMPWRRERRIPLDGQIVIASAAISLYDPASQFFRPWFTYNSAFFNRGTAVSELPGWQSFHEPGAQTAWPILMIVPIYPLFFLGIPMLACAIMRRIRRAWPRVHWSVLVAVAYVIIFVVDAVFEACVVMRMGWWEHSGWSFPFLDSYYGHNALRNIVFVAVTVTAVTCLRFFVNDRGETLIERGASQLGSAGGARVTVVRGFAVYAAILTITTVGYHVPVAISTLLFPDVAWHPSMVDNTYLNNHLCGFDTPRSCPPN
ncbi:MAG: spirocyclase AveC family protein [Sporichthyaceae bacterium]